MSQSTSGVTPDHGVTQQAVWRGMRCSTEQNAFDNIERISVKKEETSTSSERDGVSELKMCTQSNTALDIESENQEFANVTFIDSKPSYDVSNVAEN